MEVDPIVAQSAFAIPVTLGLVVYTLLGRDRTRLHFLLAGLLSTVALWLAALTLGLVATDPALRSAALDVQILTIAIMPPFFLVTMGHLARSPFLERSAAASIALFSVFACFYVAYWTNDTHGLFLTDREAAIAAAHPREWAGPLYWGLQAWCQLCDLGAVAFVVGTALRGRTVAERRRALVVLGAILLPVVAHLVYLLEWLPIEFSLAPGSLGFTAIFFVRAVHRHGLLEAQPIVRHDVLEHVHDGLLLADADGTVLDTNAAAESVLGQGREALRGQRLPAVLALLDFDGARALGERICALPLGGAGVNGEVETCDGRVMEISAGAVAARGSMPAGRFVTFRDRSAQRRSERLLRERQRLESVGILAAGVAHEVNNPLAYVRANLAHLEECIGELVKERRGVDGSAADLGEIPDLVSESLEGLERIRRVVSGMLRFSRIPDEEMRPVDVNEVVQQALHLAELQRSAGVQVEQRLAPDLPRVQGSADRLVQVLLNLFLNAKQALGTGSGGVIVAETALEGGRVVVRVRDDGPGVPEDERGRIFDPFYTTRAPGEGTGLGLSIAFDIVREHRGTLELERSATGASFAIRLPA